MKGCFCVSSLSELHDMNPRLSHVMEWVDANQTYIRERLFASVEKRRTMIRNSHQRRYDYDPGYRMRRDWQSNTISLIKSPPMRDRPTRLGCSSFAFRAHLESQFKDGMTWLNYGSLWEIDHVVPCAHFDLPKEIFQCFHYTNLRPRLAALNRLDGFKVGKGRYLKLDPYRGYC